MYALRERRVHVTQEDFELAVAKVMIGRVFSLKSLCWGFLFVDYAERFREERFVEKTLEVIDSSSFLFSNLFTLKHNIFLLLLLFVIILKDK